MNVVTFKEADCAEEIEQIHRLNHLVFAEEVKQHPQTPDGRLIDKFHERSRYFVARQGEELVGMISVHAGPVFSIESRLKDLSELRAMPAPLEVRLLAIRPEFRNRSILLGLLVQVWRYAVKHHSSDLLISGIVERVPMYLKLGFQPMGEPVPCGAAEFVPMRMDLASARERAVNWERLYEIRWGSGVSS
jgi:hypothetical protein